MEVQNYRKGSLQMIIKNVHIDKFRSIENVDFDLGSKITAIVGHNGTMKTTILGILGQTFSISKGHPMYGESTIDGYKYRSQFAEKFKLSEKDIPGTHKWKLNLYPNIYKNDYFEAHSIYRDKSDPIPRFWSTAGKGSGTGYPQIPVYYLSLKRVLPIGEEDNFEFLNQLTNEEKDFLLLEYKDIMSDLSADIQIDTIHSDKKYTASIHSSEYDALAISAGQDNLGKILISVLSFKRLMKKYPNDYKGGILLIDEIESTFHSLAQTRLIKRLYKYAGAYKIQFIFTTHSPSIIKATFFDKYNTNEAKLVYLKKEGKYVTTKNITSINDVILELSGSVKDLPVPETKITIFTEDSVALSFVKSLLNGGYRKNVTFNPCSIGAESYLELLRVKLKPITESILILDGDKNNSSIQNKIKKYKGKYVLFLPSSFCPEEMFYKFLYALDETDSFWDMELGKYDKKKCFANYPTLIERNANPNHYKNWFNEQERYWGRGNSKLYNYWKICKEDAYKTFLNSFINIYNQLAEKNNLLPLDSVE